MAIWLNPSNKKNTNLLSKIKEGLRAHPPSSFFRISSFQPPELLLLRQVNSM
ncbi:hypothetical protein HMPREF0083_02924 [Aneurinibacillus aneurinilyticus ATCC 12856]|uniref:Uncharacterized protein n=1 Tax=Aneurinibacillus aneurinilyticus ATCC 12856 TaxID=649747 RepID=U1X351_ANEAE|nr:hypothetical protein HMPREF0083_02924 [Aneurinibacillus aneurinilyticus ATCC 12856]